MTLTKRIWTVIFSLLLPTVAAADIHIVSLNIRNMG